MEIYKNPTAPIASRVEDLLQRMTLEEKVGQTNQLVGVEHFRHNLGVMNAGDLFRNTAQAIYVGCKPEDLEAWTQQGRVGSFLHVNTIEEANRLQHLAMQSRLAVPLLFGIDAIHGNAYCRDNTVYPGNLGLACSFNVELARRIARQTAAEMRAMNMHWTFNPNVEVARDARWGRCGETYGEDCYLVTRMGVATVEGLQGKLDSEADVMACAKHWVGGSLPENGTNGSPADVSERTLRTTFFPPFKAAVDAGVATVMPSHNELNGVPCHSNRWLMTDVLRGEWGFDGFVVSDWMDIEHVHDLHGTAETVEDAYRQSITAGMDMHMHGPGWVDAVCQLVRDGLISEERIDESVRRILTMKFRLGLFEHPYADEAKTMQVRLCQEHRRTALEAARQSIVLLKNNGLLPLDAKRVGKILVTGINANDENIMGDWSAQQRAENVITVLDGVRSLASEDAEVMYVDQGWDPRNMNPAMVERAAQAAREADVNIVVAGEYMMRWRWHDRTCGEDTDRSDIDLVGLQNELIERVAASGKPTVLVLINGRPLGIERVAGKVSAIVEAWESGMCGGQAIAEILFGKVNPSAKLSITIPHSVGQLRSYYDHKPSMYFHPYVCAPSEPLFPFGYGLSYTQYAYSNLSLSGEIDADGNGQIDVAVTVANTGKRDGVEIVQLYIRDEYSTFTRPVKELKDFARVELKAGGKKRVHFILTADKLAMLDGNFAPVVEPGGFVVMVGSSSRDCDLLKSRFVVKKK